MSFDLNFHIYSLLQEEPFFAALSRSIDKQMHKGIPTAGVGINEHTGHFVMYYNPDYFAKLTNEQRRGVLKHEFYHLVFEHVTSRRGYLSDVMRDNSNNHRFALMYCIAVCLDLLWCTTFYHPK